MQFATKEQREREDAVRDAEEIVETQMTEDDWADDAAPIKRVMSRLMDQRLYLCRHCGLIGGH